MEMEMEMILKRINSQPQLSRDDFSKDNMKK